MIRERLKMVRDRIAAEPPELLDMSSFSDILDDCRTARCIGGWANVCAGAKDAEGLDKAADWLELTRHQRAELFYAYSHVYNYEISLEQLTQADALAALDSLIHADSDDALPIWPEAEP